MALGYKARKRWSLAVLLIALPAWIVASVTLADWLRTRMDGLPVLMELVIFVVLGVVWIVSAQARLSRRGPARPR